MSDSDDPKVFLIDGSDPELLQANERARATFRYFWRELSWERRRIVPGLAMAAVKVPFTDGDERPPDSEDPEVEHMWLSEIDFDGHYVTGVLLNNPSWLVSVKEGDWARVPLGQISDWMYVMLDEVFGGYTVNLLRSRMNPQELREHDEAWGLNFGDPRKIRVVPEWKEEGLLKRWFGKPQPPDAEHPMSVNMAPSLREELSSNPEMLTSTDDKGWTLLHQLALAGSADGVRILLEAGADPNIEAPDGTTPLQLAQALGWEKVMGLLQGTES